MTFCRPRTAALLLLLSAVPLALIISLERSPSPSSIRYRSHGWMHECAKWDPPRRRFLVSTFINGGVAEVVVPEDGTGVLEERTLIADPDVAGNASLGIAVDERRGRLVVVYADAKRLRYSAAGAYDLVTGERQFLVQLSGPDDGVSLADDVTVDEEGIAYITDAKANKIWKLGQKGELLSEIKSPTFVQRKGWFYNFVGLNGIVYHPNGYLLVIHTSSGILFKIGVANEEVSIVKVKGSVIMGDGLALLSPTKMVVAGPLLTKLVESSDDWETATVKERHVGPVHRVASAATVKDGKVYVNYIFGRGLITEAVFTPVASV